jgi:hypothetical protein
LLQRQFVYGKNEKKVIENVLSNFSRKYAGGVEGSSVESDYVNSHVHHKDHNHNNNPPDGSNWELLCIYCHENEHARDQVADAYTTDSGDESPDNNFSHNPFAGLADRRKNKKKYDE